MKSFKFKNIAVVTIAVTASVLGGCSTMQAGDLHRPIVDGGDLTHYETDLVACQDLARSREYFNGKTKVDATIGAVIGALSESGGDRGDIIGGAIVGGALGAGSGAYEIVAERRNIVINCMRNRGYNTVESTVQVR